MAIVKKRAATGTVMVLIDEMRRDNRESMARTATAINAATAKATAKRRR